MIDKVVMLKYPELQIGRDFDKFNFERSRGAQDHLLNSDPGKCGFLMTMKTE
jgi:hypothetical protein